MIILRGSMLSSLSLNAPFYSADTVARELHLRLVETKTVHTLKVSILFVCLLFTCPNVWTILFPLQHKQLNVDLSNAFSVSRTFPPFVCWPVAFQVEASEEVSILKFSSTFVCLVQMRGVETVRVIVGHYLN